MAVKIHCPNPKCGKSYSVDGSLLGRNATCKACGRKFTLSGLDADESAGAHRSTRRGSPPKLAAARRTQQEASRSGDEETPRPQVAETSTPSVVETARPKGEPLPPGTPNKLGRFEIRTQLGTGAFGVVYRAHDPTLDREVALKVPHAGTLNTEKRKQRFLREAKSAAQLRHPNIVPIFEAGVDGDTYYIAAAFIEGQTLEAAIDEGRFDFDRSVQIVRDLAGALNYAHSRGIVHRDVKPANIMLDEKGDPLLMDFGLARLEDSSGSSEEETEPQPVVGRPPVRQPGTPARSDLTRDGAVMGTPSYMPPEQAAGLQDKISPASDQYSLGVVLYELLCGQTPFHGPPSLIISLVLNQEPPSPRVENSAIPVDLEAICLKAIAKDAAGRYTNCDELSDDLHRYQEGEPVHARQIGRTERFVRWCKRNPVVAGLSAAVAAVLLVGIVTSSYFAAEATTNAKRAEQYAADTEKKADTLQKALGRAETERIRAEKAVEQAEQNLYYARIGLAEQRWFATEIGEAERLLDECPVQLRHWEWGRLNRLCHLDLLTLKGHTYAVKSVAFSPDGRRISGSAAIKIKVWDATTGQETLTLKGHTYAIESVAFSPDGRWIASGAQDNMIKVWDVTTGQEMFTIGQTDDVYSVTFSPDGRRIASGSSDKTIKIWDATTGKEMLAIKGHTGGVLSVVFSPDGRRIASGSWDETIKIWDSTTGKETLTLKGHTGEVSSVAFSLDGRYIASGSRDNTIKVWDVTTGQETLTLKGHTDSVWSVAFSPDVHRIASGSSDKTIKIWDATTGKEMLAIKGHTGGVLSVAFSPDGRRIASGSGDKTIKIWDTMTSPGALTLNEHTHVVESVAFSPDGRRIASGSQDDTIKVWDATTNKVTLTLKGHTGPVNSVAFSPDGRHIASGSRDKTIKIWDATTGKVMLTLKGHTSSVSSAAFSPNGRRIASGSSDKTIKIWDATTGQETLTLKGHTSLVSSVMFSPDGRRIASGSWDNTIKIWETMTGQEMRAAEERESKK